MPNFPQSVVVSASCWLIANHNPRFRHPPFLLLRHRFPKSLQLRRRYPAVLNDQPIVPLLALSKLKLQMGDFSRKKARAQDGLPSVDRNNKATLPRTGPRATTKSYAKASTPGIVKLQNASKRHGLPPRRRRQQAKIQGRSLFVFNYDIWEKITAFWHGF
jgi:hypothetical protein